jgi:hypothetical protein
MYSVKFNNIYMFGDTNTYEISLILLVKLNHNEKNLWYSNEV